MTFSIVARDPGNGRFAVAVATFHLAVGATVPHLRRNTGAAASQGATNPYLAHRGLEALGNGLSANEAPSNGCLKAMTNATPGKSSCRRRRPLLSLDRRGECKWLCRPSLRRELQRGWQLA